MKEIHVACGQFAAKAGDKSHNIRCIKEQIGVAKERQCDLIVFPEMAVTGYLPPEDLAPLAEGADGPSLSALAAEAGKTGVAVVVGFAEEAAGRKHNSFALYSGTGELAGIYRKIHLWDTEAAWADPGNQVLKAVVSGTVVSGWICYDTRFPELGRLCFLEGAELCVVPTAWLGPAEEWYLSLRARALDNALFATGSDLINDIPGLQCRGLSMIADPFGEVLAKAEAGRECVIDAVLSPERLNAQRERLPLARDRKPSLYSPIVNTQLPVAQHIGRS